MELTALPGNAWHDGFSSSFNGTVENKNPKNNQNPNPKIEPPNPKNTNQNPKKPPHSSLASIKIQTIPPI
jgi:hypothetical protein